MYNVTIMRKVHNKKSLFQNQCKLLFMKPMQLCFHILSIWYAWSVEKHEFFLSEWPISYFFLQSKSCSFCRGGFPWYLRSQKIYKVFQKKGGAMENINGNSDHKVIADWLPKGDRFSCWLLLPNVLIKLNNYYKVNFQLDIIFQRTNHHLLL